MTDQDIPSDPLDGIEPPPLKEQIAPYREYGDTELALALLYFQKREQVGVPALDGGTGHSRFAVNSRPADAGFDYECQNCEENVRGVSRDASSVLACPLCGETPGMLTLGSGPQ